MKFLFVAPRFHTNSINWVKTLKKKSHEVNYAVITQSLIEEHKFVKPDVFEISKLSNFIIKIFGDKGVNNFRAFPSIFKVKLYLNELKPNVIIIRDIRRAFSIVFFITFIFFL